MFGTCVIGDMNNPTTGPSSLPATLHINASECPRPAWQHCCHRVFTCQILMNMHCVLCFLSRAWPSPFTPPPPPHLLFSPVHGALPPSQPNTTSPTSPVSPHPPPHRHWHRCMCCCMACGPPDASPGTGLPHPRTTRALWAQRSSRPAWSAWASISPTMHRYLIVAPPPSAARSLTGFSFFVLSPPCISILPYSPSILPLFPPLLFIPPVEMPFVIFHPLQRPLCGSLRLSSLTLLLVHPFLFQSLSSTIPATLPSSWFHLPIADLVEEIRNHGCGRLQNLPYLHWLQPGKAMSTLPSMNICLCVINETKLKW